MSALVEDLIGEAGVVVLAFRRQCDLMRPFGLDHAFAGKRIPHRLVFQARGVAAGNGGIAQMEMVAMGMRKLRNGDVAIRQPAGCAGNAD